jgi:hypothetical protein
MGKYRGLPRVELLKPQKATLNNNFDELLEKFLGTSLKGPPHFCGFLPLGNFQDSQGEELRKIPHILARGMKK